MPAATSFASGDWSPFAGVTSSSSLKTAIAVVAEPLLSVAVTARPTFTRSWFGGQSVSVATDAESAGGCVSRTAIVTSAVFESTVPSFAEYENESVPVKPAFGV